MILTKRLAAVILMVVLVLGILPAAAGEGAPVDESYAAELEQEAQSGDGADELVEDPEETAELDDMTEAYAGAKEALDAIGQMTNILLIGMDTRPNQRTGRSDTMILLTLDAQHDCIKMTSFLRDTYVEIPGRKSNRLNAAIVFGGPDLLISTLNKNFGAQVDHYVGVNFSMLASVIDQLGGLVLPVEKRYVPRINAIIKMDNKVLKIDIEDGLLNVTDDMFPDGEKGDILLTGKQAEAWARFRYGVPGDGDLDRAQRQRFLIQTAIDKIKSMPMTDLIALALRNLDNIVTDMSLMDMVALAPAVFALRDSEVRELQIPVKGKYRDAIVSKMAVYLPDRSANLKAFTEFILSE